ncbi:MAG: hypothetical protein MZV63_13735, partial [Marinilabiliales bacterium]|nr:hypothetical protein [Marinilabiliales bacterium]
RTRPAFGDRPTPTRGTASRRSAARPPRARSTGSGGLIWTCRSSVSRSRSGPSGQLGRQFRPGPIPGTDVSGDAVGPLADLRPALVSQHARDQGRREGVSRPDRVRRLDGLAGMADIDAGPEKTASRRAFRQGDQGEGIGLEQAGEGLGFRTRKGQHPRDGPELLIVQLQHRRTAEQAEDEVPVEIGLSQVEVEDAQTVRPGRVQEGADRGPARRRPLGQRAEADGVGARREAREAGRPGDDVPGHPFVDGVTRDPAGVQGDRDRPRRRAAHDRDTAPLEPAAAELFEDLPSGPVVADRADDHAGRAQRLGMEGEVGRGPAHLPAVREQVPEQFADPDH